MPRAATSNAAIAERVRRLKELSKDAVRSRDEHRRYTSEIAQIAISLKEELDYGQYQAVMRECGFNLKTLEKWVLAYRRSIGDAPPVQPREGHLEKVSPSERRNPLSLHGSSRTAFDPDAEADAEDEAAWADFDDDEANMPGDDDEDVDLAGEEPPHGTGDAMLLVNTGATTADDMTQPPRAMSSVALGSTPTTTAPRPLQRSGETYTAAMRAHQLTLDELYQAAEAEAEQLMQLIQARALSTDQIAEFRQFISRVTAGRAS